MSQTRIKVGIMAAGTLSMAPFALIAIIPVAIGHYYPASETTVQAAFQLPMLLTVPGLLLMGAIAGKTGKKIPLMISLVVMTLAGIAPALINPSLPVFMVMMAIFGIGLGCVMTLSVGIIPDYFQGPKQAAVMGMQSGFVNIGGMILTFSAGILLAAYWRNVFFVYLFPLLVLIFVALCIPMDRPQNAGGTKTAQKSRIKLSSEAVIMCLMIFVFGITMGTNNVNAGLLVAENALGDLAIASFGATVLAGSGIVTGLILYPHIAKVCKHNTIPVAFLVFVAGLIIMAFSPSAAVFYIGNILLGCGFTLMIPTGLARAVQSVEPTSATFTIALFLSASSTGMFIAPMVMNPLSTVLGTGTAQSRYFIAAGIIVILCVLLFLHIQRTERAKVSAAM
jgi:MFS family permease